MSDSDSLKENFNISVVITRFAFVFLAFIVITSGYVSEALSCQMRRFLMTSLYFRHMCGVIMIFVFIMMEGGWDFDYKEDDKAPTNWASGNTLHTLILGFLLYGVFLLASKSKLIPNLIFFGMLFILYVVNTYRDYIYQRKYITEEVNEKILLIEKIMTIFAFVVLIYGFIDYYFYQLADHPNDFSWIYFMFGTSKCKSLEGL